MGQDSTLEKFNKFYLIYKTFLPAQAWMEILVKDLLVIVFHDYKKYESYSPFFAFIFKLQYISFNN